MTLQGALAAMFLVGLPVLLLALGVLAHAYYVVRPRNATRTDRLIEGLVADSVDQLIAQLRTVASPPAAALRAPAPAPSRPAHAFAALAPTPEFAPLPAPSNLRMAVGQLLAEGLSDRSVARRLGVGIEEVRAVRVSRAPDRRAA